MRPRLHLSTKWTRLHLGDQNQLGQFVAAVDTAVCDSLLPFPGLPVVRPPRPIVNLTVTNNDFSQGRAWIVAGTAPLVLVSGVDFKVGKNPASTALNIAGALAQMGIDASASGIVVQVGAPASDDPFPVRAWSAGPVVNFQVQPPGGIPLPGPWDPPRRIVTP